jgi:hypothetical protein
MLHHADHGICRLTGIRRPQPNLPADRVTLSPQATHELLVNDDGLLCHVSIDKMASTA